MTTSETNPTQATETAPTETTTEGLPPVPAAAASVVTDAPLAAALTDAVAGDSDADSDEDASEGEVAEGDAVAAGGEATADGTKKKRKRRRKKKGAAAADGTTGSTDGSADGTSVEGGARAQRPKKVERERPPFGVGDIVFGKVLEVTGDVMFIDLSGKAKAIFDLRELLIPEEEARAAAAMPDDPPEEGETEASTEVSADAEASGGEVEAAPAVVAEVAPQEPKETAPKEPAPTLPRVILESGAQFVGVVHNDGSRGGCAVVTHHPERLRRTKPLVAHAAKDNSMVYGIVTGVIKGGVEVDIDGLRAFAPASHMSMRHGADLSQWVGKRLGFFVSQYAKRGRDVVVSRKSIIEAEAQETREAVLKTLEVGAEMDGVVRTVTTFGAFVDIGGIEGLVQLSEMSHNRSDKPSDVFKPGETVRVKLLRIDEKGKLALSRKACVPDPWAAVADKYALGSKHTVKVMRIHTAGFFVELEPGVDALLRRSDIILHKNEEFETLFKVSDELDIVIASFERGTQRIAVHRAPTGDQANEAPQKVVQGRHLKCVVVNVEPNGLVVRILGVTGALARGFVPASATGTARGSDLKKLFPIGKELEAKVTELDPRYGEPRLSVRALNEEQERSAYQQYRQQVKRDARFTLGDLLAKRNDK
jgi:small subunit ribosomal protein S1